LVSNSCGSLLRDFECILTMKDNFEFILSGQMYKINGLNREMNDQFLKLHEAYFSNTGFDFDVFKEVSLKFFDDKKGDYIIQDKFFNNFTIIWQNFLAMQLFDRAEQLWNDVLNIVYIWENRNQDARIHKGTPYYFLGVTSILHRDLDKGFSLMHQALEEDKITHNTQAPKTPAYSFVILDYEEQSQFFRQKVLEIARFMEARLDFYQLDGRGILNINNFKSKFLAQVSLQESVFYFVYTIFRLTKLIVETDQKLSQSVFSSLLQANMIFDLCLVVDATIKNKNPSQWKFRDHLLFLSSKASLAFNKDKLNKINDDFINDFSNTLQKLLSSKYSFQDGTLPQLIERDLAITYGFRNFGAHKIEDQPIIYKNFQPICQSILNSLFFSIEKLF